MTYFTILWIAIIGGPLQGYETSVIFASAEACEAQRPVIAEMLMGEYDFLLACEETEVESGSIRPKRRPGA